MKELTNSIVLMMAYIFIICLFIISSYMVGLVNSEYPKSHIMGMYYAFCGFLLGIFLVFLISRPQVKSNEFDNL